MDIVFDDQTTSGGIVFDDQSSGGPSFVSSELTASYNIRSFVSAELTASYAIRAFVSNELTASYAIDAEEETEMSFTPSVARTVTVSATGKTFTAGDFWSLTDPKRPRAPKDPDSTTDFTFDWTPWLTDASDEIAPGGLVFLVNEELVVEASVINGAKCTAFLSGGTVGKLASVVCRITTKSSPPRSEDRTINLTIEAR